MRTHCTLLALVSCLICHEAAACSFANAARAFVPSLKSWEQHPGPGQRGDDGAYWEEVPAPVVKVVRVTRGTAAPGLTCEDAGTLTLELSLPSDSTYDIDEFGVYFRVIKGAQPDQIFPTHPLVGVVNGKTMTLLLPWLDGSPATQTSLGLSVEAFLVTNDMHIGNPTAFSVSDE